MSLVRALIAKYASVSKSQHCVAIWNSAAAPRVGKQMSQRIVIDDKGLVRRGRRMK